MRLTRRAAILAGLAATAVPAVAYADKDPIYTGFLSSLAAGGYDVVAYFNAGQPVEGSSSHELEHQGATWRFSSADNRDAFAANPAAYAPQYGGYCAWAVSQGYTAKGDPEHWRIVDGKLYLNYNASVKRTWERDIPGNIAAGNANWPTVLAD
ncbi:MAG: YHS domain-containing (seleno)protein [Pseudomonadota bacterium]